MQNPRKSSIFFTLTWSLVALSLPSSAANELEKVFKVTQDIHESGSLSQERINEMSDAERQMYEEYKSLIRNTDYQADYNTELKNSLTEQQAEIALLEEEIAGVKITQQRITPLIREMVGRLEQFVALDLPFSLSERRQRLMKLRDKLRQPSLSVGEKYRYVLEAYQIENDYGRTIEAYKDKLRGQNDEERLVEFLRIGRLALYYQTLDGKEIGQWNRTTKQWEQLPGEYRSDIRKGLRIANKQLAPDLLALPVKTAEVTHD